MATRSYLAGRPPVFGAGNTGSIRWHCFSLKSLGYLPRFIPLLSRRLDPTSTFQTPSQRTGRALQAIEGASRGVGERVAGTMFSKGASAASAAESVAASTAVESGNAATASEIVGARGPVRLRPRSARGRFRPSKGVRSPPVVRQEIIRNVPFPSVAIAETSGDKMKSSIPSSTSSPARGTRQRPAARVHVSAVPTLEYWS